MSHREQLAALRDRFAARILKSDSNAAVSKTTTSTATPTGRGANASQLSNVAPPAPPQLVRGTSAGKSETMMEYLQSSEAKHSSEPKPAPVPVKPVYSKGAPMGIAKFFTPQPRQPREKPDTLVPEQAVASIAKAEKGSTATVGTKPAPPPSIASSTPFTVKNKNKETEEKKQKQQSSTKRKKREEEEEDTTKGKPKRKKRKRNKYIDDMAGVDHDADDDDEEDVDDDGDDEIDAAASKLDVDGDVSMKVDQDAKKKRREKRRAKNAERRAKKKKKGGERSTDDPDDEEVYNTSSDDDEDYDKPDVHEEDDNVLITQVKELEEKAVKVRMHEIEMKTQLLHPREAVLERLKLPSTAPPTTTATEEGEGREDDDDDAESKTERDRVEETRKMIEEEIKGVSARCKELRDYAASLDAKAEQLKVDAKSRRSNEDEYEEDDDEDEEMADVDDDKLDKKKKKKRSSEDKVKEAKEALVSVLPPEVRKTLDALLARVAELNQKIAEEVDPAKANANAVIADATGHGTSKKLSKADARRKFDAEQQKRASEALEVQINAEKADKLARVSEIYEIASRIYNAKAAEQKQAQDPQASDPGSDSESESDSGECKVRRLRPFEDVTFEYLLKTKLYDLFVKRIDEMARAKSSSVTDKTSPVYQWRHAMIDAQKSCTSIKYRRTRGRVEYIYSYEGLSNADGEPDNVKVTFSNDGEHAITVHDANSGEAKEMPMLVDMQKVLDKYEQSGDPFVLVPSQTKKESRSAMVGYFLLAAEHHLASIASHANAMEIDDD